MRIYLKLTPNTEVVPFNYQGHLVEKLHQWIGVNEEHDKISLYSISWLSKGKGRKGGLHFKHGAEWFISAYDVNFIKKILKGLQLDPAVGFGMRVKEVSISDTPNFSAKESFIVASPIFIKRNIEDRQQYYYYSDNEANQLLTQTLQSKLKKANLDADINVKFDTTYHNPYLKSIFYKGNKKKGSICPVIVEGSPEAVAFAWDVGIGSGTGIGFGALI